MRADIVIFMGDVMNVDMEKYNALLKEAVSVNKIICENTKKLTNIEDNIKKLLPKGYWWTFDVDKMWYAPKKYSIKRISFNSNQFYITIKESYKKLPWKGFTGEHIYSFDNFLKLNISKTEDEAKQAYLNRPCPKCGGHMGHSTNTWCHKCMTEREKVKKKFEKNHTFYEPNEGHKYVVGYTDKLTRHKGYDGKHFTIRRLDTGEIIETDNLWSYGFIRNINNLPEIEFIKSK